MFVVDDNRSRVKNSKFEKIIVPASETPESGVKAPAPSPYIMGGSNSLESDLYKSSFDTIHLSCRLFYSRQYLLEFLKERKEYLQTTEDSELPLSFVQGCGLEWNLQRVGTKLYSYILKCGDLVLMISPRKYDSQIPNCRIEIGSMSCWSGGLQAYDKITYFLSVNGAECRFNQVSRCDIAFDFLDTSICSLGVDDVSRWVTRATTFSVFTEHRRLTGIQLGRGDIVLRVYDKTEEIKRDAAKSLFFREIWGRPGEVVRVEFQARRKALKQFQNPKGTKCPETGEILPSFAAESIEDIYANADKLWQYFTCSWAKHCETAPDRKNNNQKRQKHSAFWQAVMQSRATNEYVVRVKKQTTKDIDSLKKQARGILLSIIASQDIDSNDVHKVLSQAKKLASTLLFEYIMADFTKYQKKFQQRKIESGMMLADI